MIFSLETNDRAVKKQLAAFKKFLPIIVRELSRQLAEKFLDDIEALAPGDIEGYPGCLDVFRVAGADAYMVMENPKLSRPKSIGPNQAASLLLWVDPKMRKGVPVSEGAVLLAKNNPWTMGTLPLKLRIDEAKIVSRKVRQAEIARREGELKKIVPVVRAELERMGLKPLNQSLPSVRAARDLAFEVTRAEFGIGRPGVAHWRPALRRVERNRDVILTKLWKRVTSGVGLRYNSDKGSVPFSAVKKSQAFRKLFLGR